MEQLLNVDNIAIVVLGLWIAQLIKTNTDIKKDLIAQWEIINKITDALRKIRYVPHVDKTGKLDYSDLSDE